MKHIFGNKSLPLATATALALVAGFSGTWPSIAAAGGPAVVTHNSQHKSFATEYDDGGGICGNTPPAWITYVVTLHATDTDHGDGTFNVTYGEHGTISVDYDDPAIEDVSGQFTYANHFNITNNGTSVETEHFHDFRGGVKIWFQTAFLMIDGELHVHRDFLNYTGCP